MRVLFVGECPFIPSSFGKITFWVTKGLIERGHEVFNACLAGYVTKFSEFMPYRPRDSCPGVDDVKLRERCEELFPEDLVMRVYPWVPEYVIRLAKKLGVDIVLVYGTPYAEPLAPFIELLREKGLTAVGYFVSESIALPPEYAGMVGNVKAFATPTEYVRKTFIKPMRSRGMEPPPSMVIPHGVERRLYDPALVEHLSRVVNDSFVFGTFAKNHIRKNAGSLIRAFTLLPRDVFESSKLFMALVEGAGGSNLWDMGVIESLASYLSGVSGTNERVIFLDPLQSRMGITEWSVLKIYRSIDVFVFPTTGESFGLPPLEASLLGIPIIVTDHPVMREIWGGVIPEELFVGAYHEATTNGLLMALPSPHDMARAMELLFRDESLRKEVSKKVRSHALGFTVERMVDGFVELLELGLRA